MLLSAARSDPDSAIVEPCGVSQQILKRDWLGIIFFELEETQIVIYIFIQTQFPLFHKLQHRDCGEGLGHGGEAENGVVRIHGDFLLYVRVAVALHGNDFAVFHHGNRGSRDVKLFQVLGEIRVQESSDIL